MCSVVLYLACLGLAFLVGAGIFMQRRDWPVLDRWMAASLPVGLVIVAGSIGQAFLDAPYKKWNAIRLAPSLSLLHGYTLYYPPDSGPVTGNIYTPFSSIVYLPAALGITPTGIVAVGTVLTLLFFFAPTLIVYARRASPTVDRATAVAQWVTLLVFPLATFNRMPSLGYSARFIHADAPALGLAGAACAVLYAAPVYRWNTLFLAALLAVLSVWSKQVMAPLLVALPLWLVLASGFAVCVRFCLGLLVAGGLAAGVFLTLFDAHALWFNVVTLPGHHPWRGEFPANLGGAVLEFLELSYRMALPLVVGALLPLVLCSKQPAEGFVVQAARLHDGNRAGGPPAPRGGWLAANRWSLFVVVALLVLPTSLIGRVKVGGDPNALSFALCPVLWALCLMLREGVAAPGSERLRSAMRLLTVLVVGAAAVTLIRDQWPRFEALAEPRPDATEMVHVYLQNHPGEAYFPWNPLGHLLVEGRYYHFDYGLYDRELAGFPLSEEHVRRHVPPAARLLCFPPDPNFEYVRKYLPEFSRRVEVEELPDFICYERESAP